MGTDSLIDTMVAVFIQPKSLQSNFCREHSYAIARLASLGLISTAFPFPTGEIAYGNQWRLTHKGLRLINAVEAL